MENSSEGHASDPDDPQIQRLQQLLAFGTGTAGSPRGLPRPGEALLWRTSAYSFHCIFLSFPSRAVEGHEANRMCDRTGSSSLIKEGVGETSAWLGDFRNPDLSKPRIAL